MISSRVRSSAASILGIPAADLVVENVEVENGLRLRLAIQLSLKAPDHIGRLQAHRQSPRPCQFRKHTRSQGPFLGRRYQNLQPDRVIDPIGICTPGHQQWQDEMSDDGFGHQSQRFSGRGMLRLGPVCRGH
jgi:hypothetical protein